MFLFLHPSWEKIYLGKIHMQNKKKKRKKGKKMEQRVENDTAVYPFVEENGHSGCMNRQEAR